MANIKINICNNKNIGNLNVGNFYTDKKEKFTEEFEKDRELLKLLEKKEILENEKKDNEFLKLLEMKQILEDIIFEKMKIMVTNNKNVSIKISIHPLKNKIKEFESLKKELADEKINNL